MSRATDGTETERKTQRLRQAEATSIIPYYIHHPGKPDEDIDLSIPVHNGQPVAEIQDSHHGLKTARNNISSGAKGVTVGNSVVLYSQIRNIAFSGGPLYHCDVEKLNNQDGNAATCLFSAATLQWVVDFDLDSQGLIVYLFVFGEAVDVYQN